jgi:SRSO17 transposase
MADNTEWPTAFADSTADSECATGSSLTGEFMDACAARFHRPEVRARAARYVRALYQSPARGTAMRVPRLNGEKSADGVQRLLNSARWDEDGVRDDLRHFVRGKLPQAPPVFVLAATAFTKRGTHSAGTALQITPDGTRLWCQVALFLAMVVKRETLIIDRELYTPAPEALAPARTGAVIPGQIDGHDAYAALARAMLGRALAATDAVPWVVCGDGLVDAGDLSQWLDARKCAYVLGLWHPAPRAGRPTKHDDDIDPHAPGTAALPWQWSITAAEPSRWAGQPRWILQGRAHDDRHATARYLVSAPLGTSVREMIDMAEHGLRAKAAVADARKSVGLGGYEVRTLRAWRRYTMLALIAQSIKALDQLPARMLGPDEARYSGNA